MNDKTGKITHTLLLALTCFVVAIVPLIVYLRLVPLSGVSFQFWRGQTHNFDFFSYYKMVCLVFSAAAMATLLLVRYYRDQLQVKKTYYLLPLAIYLLLAMVSTLLSEHRDVATKGYVDRYEGMYVLLSYMIVVLATLELANAKRSLQILIAALFVSATTIGTVGIFQFFDLDIFRTGFGKELILRQEYAMFAEKLRFKSGDNGVYATLFHYNYVGSYSAMLFPLSFSAFLFMEKRPQQVLAAIAFSVMFIILIVCNSRAAIIGGLLAIIMLIAILNKSLIEIWKKVTIAIVILIVSFVAFNTMADGRIGRRAMQIVSQFLLLQEDKEEPEVIESDDIKELSLTSNTATLVTTTETLTIRVDGFKIDFIDENDKLISIGKTDSKGKIAIRDKRYKDYRVILIRLRGKPAIYIHKGRYDLFFAFSKDSIGLLDHKGFPISAESVEKWGFKGKEGLGSGRGYIWSRSFPLLQETLLWGFGPDTFAINFPQHDLLGKRRAYGDVWHLVDKPHSFYLQVGINTGVVSLLALLALFLIYGIDSLILFSSHQYSDWYFGTGVSIYAAVIGYLAAALFNDSVVSVAPVFWILLGAGIGINLKLRQRRADSATASYAA